MRDSLVISVEGKEPVSRVLSMLGGCCPKPHRRLSFALSDLPKGTVITMPPTVGTPVTVSFPANPAGNQHFTFHVTATDQDSNSVTPTGLTAVSDNPLIVPTLLSSAVDFDFAVNTTDAITGTTTITDASGDTLVVSVSQTAAGTPTITLSGFADAPVLQ